MDNYPDAMQTLQDFQAFHRWLDDKNHFDTDLYYNMVLLSGEVGELAQVLKQVHFMTNSSRNEHGQVKTHAEALAAQHDNLGQELADCLAYLLKLANYTGVDLEAAYLKKMSRNLSRAWHLKIIPPDCRKAAL